MKIKKKLFLWLTSISLVATPLATVVSCQIKPEDDKNYTFGMNVDPITSLNYIKFPLAAEGAAPLVEGFVKGSPVKDSAIDNYLKLPNILLSKETGGAYNLTNYNYQSGTLRRDTKDKKVNSSSQAISFIKNDFSSLSNKYSFNINGKSKWANGELLKSSDFIDALVYMLDLNTGSQRLNDIFILNIKGTREFVDAQNEYSQVFSKTYKNPFGYKYKPLPTKATLKVKKVWTYYQQDLEGGFLLQSQNHSRASEEQKYVDKIKKTASEIGLYGDKYSSHPHPKGEVLGWNKWGKEKDGYKVDFQKEKISPFKLDVKASSPTSVFAYTVNGLLKNSKKLIPINKRYVETIGGIDEFGKNTSFFLTQGPFKISSSILGTNGYLFLKKDQSYWGAKEIIPDSIKLFFQTNPIVLGSLFSDGYISKTKINSVYTKKFFSNKKFRNLIKKTGGFGMTGLIINLDKEANVNKALMNPDFRKAILLAIDRKDIIKVSGFDSTTPSYSILEPTSTVQSYIAANRGVTIGTAFVEERMPYTNEYLAPIISSSTIQSIGINQLHSNPDQTDRLRNIPLAQNFMNKYRKENNISGNVKIEFLTDSTPFMSNMALSIKSELRNVFGDKIDFVIKSLPKIIYQTYVNSGKFQITWKNLDYLDDGSITNGVDAFMSSDGIEKKNMKSTGFLSNPSGSWTLKNAFDYYVDKNLENEVKKRLNIKNHIWSKLNELVSEPVMPGLSPEVIKTLIKQRIKAFFNVTHIPIESLPKSLKNDPKWNSVDKKFDTNREIIEIVLAANKIIMDQAAVIPVFRVDVSINIDRFPEVAYEKGQMGYGYLYDLLRKPKPNLPGLEIKGV